MISSSSKWLQNTKYCITIQGPSTTPSHFASNHEHLLNKNRTSFSISKYSVIYKKCTNMQSKDKCQSGSSNEPCKGTYDWTDFLFGSRSGLFQYVYKKHTQTKLIHCCIVYSIKYIGYFCAKCNTIDCANVHAIKESHWLDIYVISSKYQEPLNVLNFSDKLRVTRLITCGWDRSHSMLVAVCCCEDNHITIFMPSHFNVYPTWF